MAGHHPANHHPGFDQAVLQRLLDASPDVHYVARASGNYPMSFISAGIRGLAGYEPAEFTENTGFWANHIHPRDRDRVFSDLEKLRESGGRHVHEYRFRFADEKWHWIHDEFCLIPDQRDDGKRIVGTWLYTHGRRNAGTLRALENVVVTLLASDTPLSHVLDVLNQGIEARFPEMLCSVLLLDDAGIHLRHGSAPGLPESYIRAIDGVAIGPDVGSCGTAAYLKKQVVVSDIAADPLWRNFRELALEHGLRACWSTPIIGAGGTALGSFAIYYKTPRRPALGELDLVSRMTSLVAVAIEHKRAQAQARDSSTRLQAFMDYSPDMVFIKDIEGRFLTANRAFESILGVEAEKFKGKTAHDLYTYAEAERIAQYDRMVVDEKRAVSHECKLSRGDSEQIFETIKFPIFDASGRVLAIGGIDHDITRLKNTEEALRTSEQQLRTLIDNLPVLIFYCDTHCRYQHVNGTCESWYARPRNDIIGKNMADVLGREAFEKLRPFIEKALDGHRQAFDWTITYPDGETRDVHKVYVPDLDAKGNTVGFYSVVLDISDRKRAERLMRDTRENLEKNVQLRTAELERANMLLVKEIANRKRAEAENALLATFLEHAPDAVEVTDTEGVIEYVNPAHERITGFRESDALGTTPAKLHRPPEQDPAIYDEIWETISSGAVWKGEFSAIRNDGSRWEVGATIAPVFNDQREITHYIAIKHDITDNKRMQAELQAAVTKAKAADEAKGRFLANVSHELRTPLNAILGLSELLAEEPEIAATVRADAGQIHASAHQLLALIDGMLDLSRTETGKIDIEPDDFDVGETIRSVAAEIRPRIEKNGNTLEIVCAGELGRVRANESMLRKCLVNLLENAAKFTSDGHVTLTADRETFDNREWLRIRVRDTGAGIAPELTETIFDAFTQADESTTRKHGGAGLGLTIARRACDLMAGSIEVESEPGKGSTFTLRLPARL